MTNKKSAASPSSVIKNNPKRKHYEGHRQRLKERFMANEGQEFYDYELLELLLFRAIPRADCKPIAKALLENFNSLPAVLNAPSARLREVPGCGPAVILELKLMRKMHERLCQNEINRRNVFKDKDKLLAYFKAALAHLPIEQVRVMYLDKRHGLIKEDIHHSGTTDETSLYPLEILRRAIELRASFLILVHNHPSGNTEPSLVDLRVTTKLAQVISPYDIKLLDHFIIGRENYKSLKEMNFPPFYDKDNDNYIDDNEAAEPD